MKWILAFFLSCLSFSSFATSDLSILSCGQALPTNHPNFCTSFKSIATCHCQEAGLPARSCQSMNFIYGSMLARYQTVERACAAQHEVSFQVCVDDWKCYRNGGRDSAGQLCNATGRTCE